MSRHRSPAWVLLLSLLGALVLGLVRWPELVEPFRPYWLALVVAYWALESPDSMGLGRAFLLGLVADLMFGTLLGEQALRLCVIVFLVLRFRPRLRFFPLSQQALAILVLLLNDRVIVLAIRAASGEGLPPPSYWGAPFVGAVLWPWLFVLIDRARLNARHHRDG